MEKTIIADKKLNLLQSAYFTVRGTAKLRGLACDV